MERVRAVSFSRVPANPLDEAPKVGFVRDYLVIGLVTLPAMVSFSLTVENYHSMGFLGSFGLNIAIYIMLLYRFSYLASSRIAKIGGLKCGDVDLGEKMMRSVVGPFTYFNIILSLAGIGNIAYGLYAQRPLYLALHVLRENFIAELMVQDPLVGFAASALIPSVYGVNVYLLSRIILANVASIVFAIALLPIFEVFSLHLYQKLHQFIANFKDRVGEIRGGDFVEAVSLGVSLGACAIIVFHAVMAATTMLTTGVASDPSIASALTYYLLSFYPNLAPVLASQGGFTLVAPLSPSPLTPLSIWVLSTVLVAVALRFLLGALSGYLATSRVKPELIVALSAAMVAVALWSTPLLNTSLLGYATSYIASPLMGVVAVNRPLIILPDTMNPVAYFNGSYFFRLLAQVAYMAFFDLPIWVFSTMLIAYIAYYAKPAKAVVARPPVKVVRAPAEKAFKLTMKDVALSSALFLAGLAATLAAAFALYYATGLSAVWLFREVIFEVAAPEGVEYWLYLTFTLTPRVIASLLGLPSWLLENNLPIILIHNFNRCVLSAIGALAFWVAVVGLHERFRGKGNSVELYILIVAAFAAEYILFDDQFTPIAMLLIPLAAAAALKLLRRDTPLVKLLVKSSLYSLCTLEILSTAFVIGGLYMIESVTFIWLGGKGGYPYLVSILPHGAIEIPAAILATAIGLSAARKLSPSIDDPERFLEQAESMLKSSSLLVALLLAMAMFTVAAAVEAYISPQVYWSAFPLLAATIG
ncbi:MAG: stage II sporulation protein M [Candidatus Freyarchaeota archaeon]|nr:stage II sporulation protein M [Candidatus Jordarchaeia archaeon]